MADDIWKDLNLQYKAPSYNLPSMGDSADWLGNFGASGLASIGELVGITPDYKMQQWRMDNPTAALASELLGTLIPYGGWTAAAGKIPKLAKAIDWAGDLSKNAFLSGALKEGVRQAPFEAGRVLASQVVGDQDLGTMAGSGAINLALGAGVGGILEGIASAGTRNLPLARLAPGVDISAPFQLQTRFLQDALTNAGRIRPENVGTVNKKIQDLRLLSRLEKLSDSKERYVTMLKDMETPKEADFLQRLFTPDDGKSGLRRRRFTSLDSDFKTEAAWQLAAQEAGLPKNFEDLGQFFRDIRFTGNNAARDSGIYDRSLVKNMDSIGDGWLMKQEADDGLFVMARKVRGELNKPMPDDRWVIFKTDRPGDFHLPSKKWADSMIRKNAWTPFTKTAEDGGVIYNAVKGMQDKIPYTNWKAISEGNPGKVKELVGKLIPKQVKQGSNELLGRAQDFMQEFFTPTRLQFTKNARANHIYTLAREAYDAAEAEGTRIVNGQVALDPAKSLVRAALTAKPQVNEATAMSIRAAIESLGPSDLADFNRIVRKGIHGEELARMHASGDISKLALEVAKRIDAIDTEVFQGLNKAQKATGQPVTKAMAGHYGLGREWKGDTKIALRGEDGEIKAIASADNRRAARRRAEFIKEEMAKEGQTVKVAEEFRQTDLESIPKDLKPLLRTPRFTMERGNIRGWHGDFEDRTASELIDTLERNVRGRMNYQANLSVNNLFQRDIDRLAIEDPLSHKILTGRLNDLAGHHSPFGQLQNQVADRVLAPIMGTNSASKIVRYTNSAMWHLQLGAGKLSYPITNALTFLQTVMPEVAFITSAAPERLASKYTYFAAGGEKGTLGSLGVLSPLVLMKDSMVQMRKPSAELMKNFERAINEGVIDPRLVEDYIGSSATKLRDLRSAISGPEGFVNWMRAASEFMPAQSERLSRGHAFTVGHIVAKDYMQMADPDAVYRFAKQFAEHTMFLYGTADRPRALTTPIGSFFGLFKNWMANYGASMLEYTGEGLLHGNWSPLLWQTAGTFATGGLAATPMMMAADGFAEMFTGKDMLELTYDAFQGENEWAANGLMYGLPAALTGASMYSMTSTPLANPMRDANQLFSIAHMDRLEYFKKAMGYGMGHWFATGRPPGDDPRFWEQLARATMPVSIYRPIAAAQDTMINSLSSGYPVIKDVSLMDRMWYALGFNPVDLDHAFNVADKLYASQEQRSAHTARLGEAFADAQLRGDSKTMDYILRQAYASGIDPSAVNRSAMARIKKEQTPMIQRNFKPEDWGRYLGLGG